MRWVLGGLSFHVTPAKARWAMAGLGCQEVAQRYRRGYRSVSMVVVGGGGDQCRSARSSAVWPARILD